MKIGVLLKQVPDTETRLAVSADGKGFNLGDVKWVMSPYDEYAVEAALKAKEAKGGEVVIISAGPARTVEAMRTALAMGADRGVRIDTDGVEMDSFTTATVLAKVVQEEKCDLVLGGKQAIDDDCAQVIAAVAELCDWPHVSPVDVLTLGDDGASVTVERPVSGGAKQVIKSALPAVIGCDKGLNTPRYASLPGIMKAKSKKIDEKKAADLLASVSPLTSVSAVTLPPERQAGRVVEGDPADLAEQLVRYLREEAKVI